LARKIAAAKKEAAKARAGKKEGGWGEGIFARPLDFPINQNSQSGFLSKKVRILSKRHRIVCNLVKIYFF